MHILTSPDSAPLEPLLERRVAVLGYGNQGQAHALNLRDSGIDLVVGLRSGSPRIAQAQQSGFTVASIDDAVADADLIIMAVPDEAQGAVYAEHIAENAPHGATLGFLHGFAIRFGLLKPREDLGVALVAPKGPGATLRHRFNEGNGIPCLFAVHQDSARGDTEALALAWCNGIGCARAAIIYTTFAAETETDLFGEQAVLCGGMTQLILAAFETLVQAGYPPELAYIECCHEVKQVADLVYERGLSGMMNAISNTAEFGAHDAGSRVIDAAVRKQLDNVLADIRSGEFAMRFMADRAAGNPMLNKHRDALTTHPIEHAGVVVRSLMPWLAVREQPESAED